MKKLFLLGLTGLFLGVSSSVYAQFGEPEVQKQEKPKNLYDEGYRSGFGFLFDINDFGIGVGGQFRKGLGPYTEALVSFKIAGLRDTREQTYIDIFFGTRTIPDKFQRVVSFPLKVGVKRRLFADQITDNFRVFGSISGGPVLAYSYPYFNDSNNNGFRESSFLLYGRVERTNDIFTGWKEAESHFGWTGDVQVGIDFSSNFASLQSIQFGYNFNYFNKGIQILEPNRPDLDSNGRLQFDQSGDVIVEPNHKPGKFYGSAQISFIFGWMWN